MQNKDNWENLDKALAMFDPSFKLERGPQGIQEQREPIDPPATMKILTYRIFFNEESEGFICLCDQIPFKFDGGIDEVEALYNLRRSIESLLQEHNLNLSDLKKLNEMQPWRTFGWGLIDDSHHSFRVYYDLKIGKWVASYDQMPSLNCSSDNEEKALALLLPRVYEQIQYNIFNTKKFTRYD